jgi:hypothetical protein
MLALPIRDFPHRLNEDGTFDSICPKCFDTVATAESESGLEKGELSHICDPSRLAALQTIEKKDTWSDACT